MPTVAMDINWGGSMVGKYNVNQVIELLFDNEFNLSYDETGEKEGKDTHLGRQVS